MPNPCPDHPPAHLLIFDSGVGGLSITEAIRRQYPHCGITYVSDNAAFPYGTKTEAELLYRVERVLGQLHEIIRPDIIVVACNTASTVVLPRIRERFALPIVGVVPAIKPAAALSRTRVIGLLATPGTIQRPYTLQLIDEFAGDCRVVSVGSSELVELAEGKLRGEAVPQKALASIVAPFRASHDLDTIVLACTHFPLLKTELRAVLPDPVHWVDSAEAIARRVGYYLERLSGKPGGRYSAAERYASFFTANTPEVATLLPYLENHQLGKVNFIEIIG